MAAEGRSRRTRVISALVSLAAADAALWFERYASAAVFAVFAAWSAASLAGWWSVEDTPARESRLTRLALADWVPPLATVISVVWLVGAFYLGGVINQGGSMTVALLPTFGLLWIWRKRQAATAQATND